MFEVVSNNGPIGYPGCPIENTFPTLAQATAYAHRWLHQYSASVPKEMKADTVYDYTGHGDTIEIRESTDFDVEKTIEWLHQLKTRQLEALLLATALQLTTRDEKFDPIYEYLEKRVLQ